MKKKVIIILSIIVCVIIILVLLFAIFNPFLTIKLNGNDNTVVEYGSHYKEKNATSKSLLINLSNKIKISSNVDEKKIGNYKVKYEIKYLLKTKTITRNVKVEDTTLPTITLKGKSEVNMYVGDKYSEAGYSAFDNYDQDITNKVKVNNSCDYSKKGKCEILYEVSDSSGNKASIKRVVNISEKPKEKGITYINGILLVNKKYSLPKDYAPGVNGEAGKALEKLQKDAKKAGYSMNLISGFRSYYDQQVLYNNYVKRDGKEIASTYSAEPGHSEHQTGLAFDVGKIDNNYGNTPAGKWLASNAYKYGFIIRYPKGKESITGYMYEPWHIRYLGVEHAKNIYEKGVTLEEYLGV